MTGKEYLLRIKKLTTDLQNIEDEIRRTKEDQITIRSAWPDGQPHGTGGSDPVGEMAIRIIEKLKDKCEEYERKRLRLMKEKDDIIDTISKLSHPEYSRILYLRYVSFYTWEEIAVDMHYTYQWVAGPLHGNALAEIEKIINT